MTISEALLVTVLGMGVVCAGLVVCIGFIDLFRRLSARVSAGAGAESGPVRAGQRDEPVPPDVLAVIVAVLEVERALYVGRYRSRVTLNRASASGVHHA